MQISMGVQEGSTYGKLADSWGGGEIETVSQVNINNIVSWQMEVYTRSEYENRGLNYTASYHTSMAYV